MRYICVQLNAYVPICYVCVQLYSYVTHLLRIRLCDICAFTYIFKITRTSVRLSLRQRFAKAVCVAYIYERLYLKCWYVVSDQQLHEIEVTFVSKLFIIFKTQGHRFRHFAFTLAESTLQGKPGNYSLAFKVGTINRIIDWLIDNFHKNDYRYRFANNRSFDFCACYFTVLTLGIQFCGVLSGSILFAQRKRENFQIKNSYNSYFCSKHRLWVLIRIASARRF